MARTRRQVGGGAGKFKKFTSFAEGDYIVGKYLKTGVDAKYGKPTYTFELTGFEMESPTFDHPKDEEIEIGSQLTLNSTGTLDNRMKEVEIGNEVEIVYNGKSELPKGHPYAGTLAHQFDVFICGEDGEEVSTEGDDGL